MKIAVFKQHFYRYIDRAEYAMALSLVIGTIVTMIPQGYSSYLSDRNKRIERLNKKPLNHINVDYISFEKYQWMINKNNWKSASLKPNDLNLKKNNYKDEVIETINVWLMKKTKKKANNSEVDPESLRKLAAMNNRAITASILKKNSIEQSIENNAINANNNLINEKNNLPPNRKPEAEQQKYFIVQESGGLRRYDPAQFRINKKKQNLKSASSKQNVGIIGGKNIEKDESIFQSIMRIFRAILYKDTKKSGQVINSNYDQYGNRIKKTRNTSTKQSGAIEENEENFVNKIDTDNSDYDREKNNTIFLTPTFIIDGNLQQMNNFNKIKRISTTNSGSAANFQILADLEYTFEKCWYKKYKNIYGNNFISALFTVSYNRDAEVSNITINSIDNKIEHQVQQQFIDDMVDMLSTCDISKTQNITKNNYNIWGKIRIQFNDK